MKHLKMLGLALVAAMALTAFVANSASATILEKVEGGVTTKLGVGATLDGSLESSALLQNTEKTLTFDTCTGSTITGTITNAGGAGNVVGKVEKGGLTWTGCTEKTETLAGGQLEIKWLSGTEGEVIGKEFEVTTQNTIFSTSCVYTLGTGTKLGTLVTSSTKTGTLAINTGVALKSGLGCPTSASWTANYVITNPDILLVTKE